MSPTKTVFMIRRVFGDRKGLPSAPQCQFPEWSFCKNRQPQSVIQLDMWGTTPESFQSSQNLSQQYNCERCCAETCREAECKGRRTGTLPLLSVKLKSCRQCLRPKLHGTGAGTSLPVRSPPPSLPGAAPPSSRIMTCSRGINTHLPDLYTMKEEDTPVGCFMDWFRWRNSREA